ncbi:hypothetical protein JCM33374_g1361 [Metschnikowia sp. JCM 33374]|nr:hypothetical protein JCM33374_g1361 [Metschnikowia sp. JCM 33374]
MFGYHQSDRELESTGHHTMLDYWCNNLPFDHLLTMKDRGLHNHLTSGFKVPQPQTRVQQSLRNYPRYQSDFVSDMESLSFNDPPRSQGVSVGQSGLLRKPKPKSQHNFKSHLFADQKVQETSYGSIHRPRIQHGPEWHWTSTARHSSSRVRTVAMSIAAYEESLNRQSNSSSVPTSTQKYSVAAIMSGGALGQPKAKKEGDFKPKISSPSTPVEQLFDAGEIVNQDLLNNIPAWLKVARLHKYTDYLRTSTGRIWWSWTDEDLEDRESRPLVLHV